MPAINNSLSALGISWAEESHADETGAEMRLLSMESFARAVRSDSTHSLATNVLEDHTSAPARVEEQLDRDASNSASGQKLQNPSPSTIDRQRPMRVLTRKGRVLESNPYRLPGVRDGTAPEGVQRPKDDFDISYPSKALPTSNKQQAQMTPYFDEEALTKLEANALFPPHDEHRRSSRDENVPMSKFSPYDSDSQEETIGIFRSFSTRVRKSFRRPKRPEISAPLLDLKHEPEGPAGILAVMHVALPLGKPAPELERRAYSIPEAIEMRRANTIAHAKRPFKLAQSENKQIAVLPQPSVRPRNVRIVGESNRTTSLGDFIHADRTSFISNDVAAIDHSDHERSLLSSPKRPAKKVDTSKYSWMPPESTYRQEGHFTDKHPTVDSLFDDTDQQAANVSIEYHARLAKNQERRQAFDRSASRDDHHEEDEEREVMIDTYINGNEVTWRAVERVGDRTIPSTQRQYHQNRKVSRSDGEDEAAALWRRPEALRH